MNRISDDDCLVNHVKLDGRVTVLERIAEKNTHALESIASSLSRIATIEERHEATSKSVARAFSEIAELEKAAEAKFEKMECALAERIDKAEEEFVAICHKIKMEFDGMCDAKEARLRIVENQMEALQLIKQWVISAVVGIVAIFSMLVIHYVFKV